MEMCGSWYASARLARHSALELQDVPENRLPGLAVLAPAACRKLVLAGGADSIVIVQHIPQMVEHRNLLAVAPDERAEVLACAVVSGSTYLPFDPISQIRG